VIFNLYKKLIILNLNLNQPNIEHIAEGIATIDQQLLVRWCL